MSESVQRQPQSRPDEVVEDPGTPADDAVGDRAAAARKVSQATEDLLNEMDRSMEATLFDQDEVVTPDEFAKRAQVFVNSMVQKGGE